MIDLFADLKYEQDCENKLEYLKFLSGTSSDDLPAGLVVTGTPTLYYYDTSDAIFAISSGVVTIKSSSGKYYNAIKLSNNLTKFLP